MDITREIILDLLPLYLAGELSDDSRAAVDQFLSDDPELSRQVREIEALHADQIPLPLHKEREMEAYRKVRRLMVLRTLGLAVIIAGTLLAIVLVAPLIYMFVF
jgi:anti-sigma factor RsiW